MKSLKLPFSVLFFLVIAGFLFVQEEQDKRWMDFKLQGKHDTHKDFIDLRHRTTVIDTYGENATNSPIREAGRKLIEKSGNGTTSKTLLRIRKKVSAVVALRDAIQIFHRNIPPQNFRYINSSDRKQPMNYEMMSETMMLLPRRCALVGNSGILSGSKCGPEIDAHDFVMRMNLAPSGGIFADDVGSKVSITTMNWEQLKLAVRCTRNRTEGITDVCADLAVRMLQTDDGIIWYTKGGYTERLGVVAGEFLQSYAGEERHVGPRWAYSPIVMQGVCKTLWKRKNPSTGLIAFSVASLFCDEISLYGFYPYEKDPQNRTIKFHYYESQSSTVLFYNKHRMPNEFRIFKKFAKRASPSNRLVIHPCA